MQEEVFKEMSDIATELFAGKEPRKGNFFNTFYNSFFLKRQQKKFLQNF